VKRQPIKRKVGIRMSDKLELIDKVKLMDWLKFEINCWQSDDEEDIRWILGLVLREINRGTFDIKESIGKGDETDGKVS
jgi:hypothetical protein